MDLIGPADAGGLAALHAVAAQDAWSRSAFETLLSSPGVFGFHEPAGFILCRAVADEAEILMLAVAPEHRRQGVAARLLAHALGWATGLACDTMFLEVAEDNAAAIPLYRAAGFREIGRRRAYYKRPGSDVDALVMRRDLNR